MVDLDKPFDVEVFHRSETTVRAKVISRFLVPTDLLLECIFNWRSNSTRS